MLLLLKYPFEYNQPQKFHLQACCYSEERFIDSFVGIYRRYVTQNIRTAGSHIDRKRGEIVKPIT